MIETRSFLCNLPSSLRKFFNISQSGKPFNSTIFNLTFNILPVGKRSEVLRGLLGGRGTYIEKY